MNYYELHEYTNADLNLLVAFNALMEEQAVKDFLRSVDFYTKVMGFRKAFGGDIGAVADRVLFTLGYRLTTTRVLLGCGNWGQL
jgi:hypothetical protein